MSNKVYSVSLHQVTPVRHPQSGMVAKEARQGPVSNLILTTDDGIPPNRTLSPTWRT